MAERRFAQVQQASDFDVDMASSRYSKSMKYLLELFENEVRMTVKSTALGRCISNRQQSAQDVDVSNQTSVL